MRLSVRFAQVSPSELLDSVLGLYPGHLFSAPTWCQVVVTSVQCQCLCKRPSDVYVNTHHQTLGHMVLQSAFCFQASCLFPATTQPLHPTPPRPGLAPLNPWQFLVSGCSLLLL